MNSIYDKVHANKSERLKSFENTVKNIFDEKLNKFGDCFEKAKNLRSITHVQIFDNDGKYYFRKVNGSFKDALLQFDEDGRDLRNIKNLKSLRNDNNLKKYLYYTRYILFRTVSLKNSKNSMCNKGYELDQDLQCLVDEEELRHYMHSTLLFRLCESL